MIDVVVRSKKKGKEKEKSYLFSSLSIADC